MPEREQIINFLLTACDAKNKAIDELRKQIADLQRAASEEGKKADGE